MNRKTLLMLITAVIAVAIVTVVIASSFTGSSSTHVMPGGHTMDGEMHDDQDMPMRDESR